MQCMCSVTRDCVFIPEDRENHIIDRHFNPSANDEQEPRRAFFIEHAFSPEELFDTVVNELRMGLQPHEESGNLYAYHLHYPVDVGYFPYQPHGRPAFTAIVRVVCQFRVCQYCFMHCPSQVVSIYPWMWKKIEYKRVSTYVVVLSPRSKRKYYTFHKSTRNFTFASSQNWRQTDIRASKKADCRTLHAKRF